MKLIKFNFYITKNIVGYLVRYKTAFGFFANSIRQTSSKDFCSELANKFWGFEIENHQESSKKLVSPKDFYNRLKYYRYGKV